MLCYFKLKKMQITLEFYAFFSFCTLSIITAIAQFFYCNIASGKYFWEKKTVSTSEKGLQCVSSRGVTDESSR